VTQIGTVGQTTGRSGVAGPFQGAYAVLPVDVGGQLAADVYPGNATFIKYVTLPFDCRVMEVSFMADVCATAGTHTWGVQNGGAAGAGTTDIVAANSVPTSDTVETVAAAALTNRNCVKGDILRILNIGTSASDIVTRGTVTITVWVRDHVVASSSND
jgi:hypothetical protein